MHANLIPGIEPGCDVAVLATGASLTEDVAAAARAYPCVAVTDAYLRAPWAKALYAHDALWWQVTPGAHDFAGMKLAGQETPHAELAATEEERVLIAPGHEVQLRASGLAAIRIVADHEPKRIHLYGFDCKPGHFHKEHKPPRVLPTTETYEMWAVGLEALTAELRDRGIEVVHHGAPYWLPPLIVEGMNGLGDCIHQRGVVGPLSRRRQVWLRTPWPQLYQDMPRVRCLPRNSRMRNAKANEERSAHLFAREADLPKVAAVRSCGYWRAAVREHGSVLGAMGAALKVTPADFRMSVPAAWCDAARNLLPLGARYMIYRPLIARAEAPSPARTPDPQAYAELFARAREGYFVVSVANVEPGKEWTVGPQPEVDLALNAGELTTETLIGLFSQAALVFTPPGFATILAQAVNTPAITVFGGFEDARSFTPGATFSPWLPIEPVKPCACWNLEHDCDKTIDLAAAREAIDQFIGRHG